MSKSNSGAFAQFLSYLQNGIATMDGLEYWFDERKITGAGETQKKTKVKEEFRKMMLTGNTLTQRGDDVFNAIWENSNLARSIFGPDIDVNLPNDKIDSYDEFKVLLLDVNNSFYNFILVK